MSQFSIGLTGGIGCGKTTVAEHFAGRGAAIIDTDQIAHALTGPRGAAMNAIVAAFGQRFAQADGALDRAAMRTLVFADGAAKARLEAILHPLIRHDAEAAAAAATAAGAPYLVFVVPLLIESGNWRDRVQRVLVIDCDENTQISRVMTRNGLQETQVKAIMATQVPRMVRLAAADDVIVNDDGLDVLIPQIERLHQLYLTFSQRLATISPERL